MKQQSLPSSESSRGRAGIGLPILAASNASAVASEPSLANRHAPVVGFVSLGCAKNLVDSEKMLGQLAESGAVITGDESAADTMVVNTCGFLENSRAEALEVLHELAARKRAGSLRRIVVAGCLVQRDGEKIKQWVPEVDALVGVNNRADVVRAVWRLDRDEQLDRYLGDYHPLPRGAWNDQTRLRLTPRHYAYVRLSEGCNQRCTFCTIPSIRGPMHSKHPDELTAECQELIRDGARELIFIGQDTTSYGVDLGYEPGLAGLIEHLDRACDGADWLRLMYVYPSILTDRMLDALAAAQRFVKYIDIPLQHVNDRMLKAMHRRVTRAQTETLLERIRRRIPGVAIRTTFIVGFPGETEQQFDEMLEFVREFGFDSAGAFQYSREPETPAGRMRAQLDADVKRDRYQRFMLTQQEVALAAARRRIGQTLDVLIDDDQDERGLVGRYYGQAPEVDAVCILPDDQSPAKTGGFVQARVIDTDDYDLVAKTVKPGQRAPLPSPV